MELLKVTELKKTYTSRLGGAQVQALGGVTCLSASWPRLASFC